jgi:hypothetical protein
VSLVVNGKTTATKTVAVPANGRATVDFPALEVPYGFSRCEVKIDAADGFPADDLRRFAVERSDPQKALLIHNYGDNRSPLYVGAALSAAAQSAFILESINVNEAADRKPSNYAFIVLSDLNSLPSLLENSLTGTCAPAAVSDRRRHLRRRPLADSHFRRAHHRDPRLQPRSRSLHGGRLQRLLLPRRGQGRRLAGREVFLRSRCRSRRRRA